MYFTAVGYCMISTGNAIHLVNKGEGEYINDDSENSVKILFSGGFIITLFCVSFIAHAIKE